MCVEDIKIDTLHLHFPMIGWPQAKNPATKKKTNFNS